MTAGMYKTKQKKNIMAVSANVCSQWKHSSEIGEQDPKATSSATPVLASLVEAIRVAWANGLLTMSSALVAMVVVSMARISIRKCRFLFCEEYPLLASPMLAIYFFKIPFTLFLVLNFVYVFFFFKFLLSSALLQLLQNKLFERIFSGLPTAITLFFLSYFRNNEK